MLRMAYICLNLQLAWHLWICDWELMAIFIFHLLLCCHQCGYFIYFLFLISCHRVPLSNSSISFFYYYYGKFQTYDSRRNSIYNALPVPTKFKSHQFQQSLSFFNLCFKYIPWTHVFLEYCEAKCKHQFIIQKHTLMDKDPFYHNHGTISHPRQWLRLTWQHLLPNNVSVFPICLLNVLIQFVWSNYGPKGSTYCRWSICCLEPLNTVPFPTRLLRAISFLSRRKYHLLTSCQDWRNKGVLV